jgi:hypothetical protein
MHKNSLFHISAPVKQKQTASEDYEDNEFKDKGRAGDEDAASATTSDSSPEQLTQVSCMICLKV